MMQCKRRTSGRRQENGLGAEYTKAAAVIPVEPVVNVI